MTPRTARTFWPRPRTFDRALRAHFLASTAHFARTSRTSRALFRAKVRARNGRFRAWQDSEPPKNGPLEMITRKPRALCALFTHNLLYLFEKVRERGEREKERDRKIAPEVRKVREVRAPLPPGRPKMPVLVYPYGGNKLLELSDPLEGDVRPKNGRWLTHWELKK